MIPVAIPSVVMAAARRPSARATAPTRAMLAPGERGSSISGPTPTQNWPSMITNTTSASPRSRPAGASFRADLLLAVRVQRVEHGDRRLPLGFVVGVVQQAHALEKRLN